MREATSLGLSARRSTLYGQLAMTDRPPGYDDWFDEPEPPAPEPGRSARPSYDAVEEEPEDVWVIPEDAPRRARRSRRGGGDVAIAGRTLTTTQVAILAAAGLAVFIAILAAAGVFNSGGKSGGPTIPSTTLPTTTSSTSTLPNITATPPTAQLKEGDTGHQVKLLQRALTALGYSPGKADGSFGPGTKAAVELFQSANGLTSDGLVGNKTLAALRQALAG